MDGGMVTTLSDTRKLREEVVVDKAVITKITIGRVANNQARKLAEARSESLERIGIDY